MKTCTRCNETKELSAFHKKASIKRDGLQSHCKACEKIAHRNHYEANKNTYVKRSSERRMRLAQEYHAWKTQQKCCRCDETDECCLEMHHFNPSEKEHGLASFAMSNFGNDAWYAELAKCIIVCSNCHKKIHRYEL